MSFDKEKEQLALALDLARIGFYDWNVVEDVIVYNKHMLDDWGISDPTGMKLGDAISHIHPADRDRVANLVNEAMEKRSTYSTEYRVVRPDGTIVWMDVNGLVTYDGDQPVRFFGTCVNITERKHKEILLEENEAMIRTFADTMPQMAFIADASGAIIHFNQRWYDYVSANNTEGWGWKDQPIHHPEDLERTIATWSHSLKTGEPYEIDYRLRRHDGEYRWHLGRALPYRNKQGQIVFWYGTNTDIHEERISLERNRLLYDFGFALSKGLSPKEIAQSILEEGKKILKSSGGIVLFADGENYKIAASQSVPESFLLNALFTENETRMPAKSALKEGRAFFLSNRHEIVSEFPAFESALEGLNAHAIVAMPLKIQKRTIASVVFFIDENRVFSEELQRFFESLASQAAVAVDRAILFEQQEFQKDELQDALKSRDEFFSIASHELKTPLTSMRLNGQLLMKMMERFPEKVTSKDHENFLLLNDRSVSKLVRLVDDMLDISRIRTGRMALRKENFDICDLLKEVIHRTESSTEVPIGVEICEPAKGNWDRMRIDQVITNLVSNAVRYGKNKPIATQVHRQENNIILSVKDQGMGIPKELLETIFERYERGPTGDVQGLGLGLYISRNIVESHGGKLWAESMPGNGSTFFVELPLANS